MGRATKNGALVNKPTGKKVRKNKPTKSEQVDVLNNILFQIAKLKGYVTESGVTDSIKDKYAARICKELGISSNGAKYQSKQISGFIGMAKGELRKLKRV